MNGTINNDKVDLVVIPSDHGITFNTNLGDDDKNNVIEEHDSFESVEYLYDRNLDDNLNDYLNNLN
ncbi:hypothetical protein KM1_331320 [Entamoeba histolytica HM-3:IMSS]|uniref:Uncharacterized protein n=1 Tax=Entamoeba histolytica HM-3:IMSS TaxID=885315 RepID=M7W1W8_ENTHI|nr:hypothetical protein KM1_331320 [Entamoeba histolytica HM-3:IMSS]